MKDDKIKTQVEGLTKFVDTILKDPNKYSVDGVDKIIIPNWSIEKEGTLDKAEYFNKIQKNCIYKVYGSREMENTEEIYDINISGMVEFGDLDINLLFIPDKVNTTQNLFIRFNKKKYKIMKGKLPILIGDFRVEGIIGIRLDVANLTADIYSILSQTEDILTSTSKMNSLSANMGKILQDTKFSNDGGEIDLSQEKKVTITNRKKAEYTYSLALYNPEMEAGNYTGIQIGKSNSPYNCGEISYYKGKDDSSNKMNFGFNTINSILNIKSNNTIALNGFTTIGRGFYLKFPYATGESQDDGRIGARLFDSGLNIVGIRTEATAIHGTEGRVISTWGNIIQRQSTDQIKLGRHPNSDMEAATKWSSENLKKLIVSSPTEMLGGRIFTKAQDNNINTTNRAFQSETLDGKFLGYFDFTKTGERDGKNEGKISMNISAGGYGDKKIFETVLAATPGIYFEGGVSVASLTNRSMLVTKENVKSFNGISVENFLNIQPIEYDKILPEIKGLPQELIDAQNIERHKIGFAYENIKSLELIGAIDGKEENYTGGIDSVALLALNTAMLQKVVTLLSDQGFNLDTTEIKNKKNKLPEVDTIQYRKFIQEEYDKLQEQRNLMHKGGKI
ncbi:MAG: hypothetical protein ACRC54_02035 [Fusobacteriaceae bacterium]